SSPASSSSVSAKIKSSAYATLDEFLDDVDAAASQLLDPLTAREAVQPPGTHVRLNPLSLAETRLLTGALALKKLARKLIANERGLRHSHRPNTPVASQDAIKNEKPTTNGVIELKLESDDGGELPGLGGRNVLTLFGNAQGPKQLFSSLQQPSRAASVLGKRPASSLDDGVDVTLPLRDELLPNMISTTKILPVQSEEPASKKPGPTFGEVFREPANARILTPPKPKQSTSRGTTITWEFPDTRPKRRGSYNYTITPASVGQWLGYRGVDVTQEPSSPEAKRKQRDRALSTGEARPQLSDEARAAVEQAKEDALFRSVYSSFAPSRDDSAAVIPAQTKDMVWWHKIGEKKFVEQFAVDTQMIDPALMDADESPSKALQNGEDEAGLKEAVENFEPDEPLSLTDAKRGGTGNETEDLLQEISELLETLNSYQRIRNASLASTSHTRTPSMSSQRETMTNMSGSPTSPTLAEVDVYNMLKTQLTLMINQLPPFAVAKLNGEQLSDLNVTKSILIETKDYRGIMEEDQVTRLAKASALNAAVGPPNSRMATGPTSNQYNPSGPGYARPAGGQLGAGRSSSQNYFPQQQPPNRTPSMPMPRAGQYNTPTTFHNTGAPRPGFQPQQSYNHNSIRGPGYASTPLSNTNQQYGGQGQAKTANYPQYYQNSPQAQPQGRGSFSQPQQGQQQQSYQPRPGSAGPAQQAQMYPYGGPPQAAGSASPHPRTASPLKTPLPQNPLRPSYQTPAPGPTYGVLKNTSMPVQQQQQQQSAGNNTTATINGSSASAAAPTPQTSSVGPSGFHSSMSDAEQTSMLERQRALAQQRQQEQQDVSGSASPAAR
ncbi:MAG: hypothetical protein INR71_06675, partial [Terriglobus roseus]|nr:hypothetical protein [Terriglobus roseus]